MEDLIRQFGAICPRVRFILRCEKSILWQKPAVSDTRSALLHVWGSGPLSHMDHLHKENAELKVTLGDGMECH